MYITHFKGLITDRLIIARCTQSDIEPVLKLISESAKEIAEYFTGHDFSSEAISDYLTLSENQWHSGNIQPMVIIRKEDREIIGMTGFEYQDVGLWIGTKYTRQGYGREALKAVVNLALNDWGWDKVTAGVHRDNDASRTIAARTGFKVVSRKPKYFYLEIRNEN